MIPFNKPFLSGNELKYIEQAVASGKISGDGEFTTRCHDFFLDRYGFRKCLLTTSCTDALEMAAILLDIKEGDEVIMPSFTFVSTANAFALRGATIVFCDSRRDHPGIDEDKIESLITSKTRVLTVVHYAGVACNMDKVLALASKHKLYVVEDAAQAIDSFYINSAGSLMPLGSLGHLSAFSFHETKNIISGEGGMLVVNDEKFTERAEVIREKGTNRSKYFRGEIDKYGWVDIGSSFLPSEIVSAFLFAQLQSIDQIQEKRLAIWNEYWSGLEHLEFSGKIKRPIVPKYATNNAHMFYLICESRELRDYLILGLKNRGVLSVFHYQSLHRSEYFKRKYSGSDLLNADRYSDNLLRLPLFYELELTQVQFICKSISDLIDKYVAVTASN